MLGHYVYEKTFSYGRETKTKRNNPIGGTENVKENGKFKKKKTCH